MRAGMLIRKGLVTIRHLFKPAKTDEVKPPNTHNPFLNLPPELILSIAKFLDQEARVLLSLSCKRLRLVLNTNFDLSLCDLASRTNFLRYLEVDYPEFLTCRTCGWMFRWRRRRCVSYQCPRYMSHSREGKLEIGRTIVCWCHYIYLREELLELVLRAYRRGRQHGIPLSFLNSNTFARPQYGLKETNPAINATRLETQARMVDGQLMLLSCWTVDLETTETLERDVHIFNNSLCMHYMTIIREGLWDTIVQKALKAEDVEQPISHKCSFCATDYKIHLQKGEIGGLRIVLKVWRNFGNGYSNTWDVEQVFYNSRESRIDADTLSRRDLEATFLSKEGMVDFATSCQHRGLNDCRMIDED